MHIDTSAGTAPILNEAFVLLKRASLVAVAAACACAYQPTPRSDTFGFPGLVKPQVRMLEKRAQYDLSCGAGDLAYKKIEPFLVGVEGCGQKKLYRYDDERDTWLDDDKVMRVDVN